MLPHLATAPDLISEPAAPTGADDALAALAAGHPVAMLGAQPQIVCAARGIRAETVNLMAHHGRGLVCHAMEAGQMLRLGLALLPAKGGSGTRWRFANSYEAASGCTTGISAAERALTMNAGAAAGAGGADISQPGHVIPVLGDPRGDTAPDLALRLLAAAGVEGGAAICTILDTAGAVAGPAEVAALADRLGMALIDPAEVPA